MAHDVACNILKLSESKCTAAVRVTTYFKRRKPGEGYDMDTIVFAAAWRGDTLLLTRGNMTLAFKEQDEAARRAVGLVLRSEASFYTEPWFPCRKAGATLSHAVVEMLPFREEYLVHEDFVEEGENVGPPFVSASVRSDRVVEDAARTVVEYIKLARHLVV